jgi:predicted aminopeptidase
MKANLLITIFLVIILNGCSALYIAKQGFYQLKLIYESEPIEIALRRPDLPQNSREKLKLILDVRAFAQKYLHLNAQKNYKDVDLDYNVVVNTVSACESLAFKPYEWWFPILGFVPYKGFFDKKDADKEEARLKSLGYETQNRPIQGYSTLGFFADPIWPKMLLLEDFELIELIIHELTHATIYFPNQTIFNESLANFIGVIGTELYLKNKFKNDSQQVKNYLNHQENLKAYNTFFHDLYQRLEKTYNESSPKPDKEKDKEAILLDAK